MTVLHHTQIKPPAVISRLLDGQEWLVHGFTRRVAGMGQADGNVSYSGGRDQADAWAMRQRWLEPLGLDPEAIVTTGQVHGHDVIAVAATDAGRGARPGSAILGMADATMTDTAGPVLFSLHADCLSILLADPVRRVVAVTHAGWRGTVADIAGETIRAMAGQFGSRPAEILAFLGPAISGDHYEVGPEVVSAWKELPGASSAAYRIGAGDRWQFDTVTANETRLIAAGLRPDHIERSGICTWLSSDHWFSHRAQGPTTGRFGAVISIR